MNEFGLQFLQSCLRLLLLGEVAHKTCEVGLSTGSHLSNGEMHGNVVPSLRIPVTIRPMPMMRRSPV